MKDEITKNSNKSRVALTESNTDAIQKWRSQLCEEFAGIKISESDLTNWAIKAIGCELSKRQLEDIKNEYFDEVKQLEWMLAQAKSARANQDHEILSKLLGSIKRQPKREKISPDQSPSFSSVSDSPSSPNS